VHAHVRAPPAVRRSTWSSATCHIQRGRGVTTWLDRRAPRAQIVGHAAAQRRQPGRPPDATAASLAGMAYYHSCAMGCLSWAATERRGSAVAARRLHSTRRRCRIQLYHCRLYHGSSTHRRRDATPCPHHTTLRHLGTTSTSPRPRCCVVAPRTAGRGHDGNIYKHMHMYMIHMARVREEDF
jgi:hypothetical protein